MRATGLSSSSPASPVDSLQDLAHIGVHPEYITDESVILVCHAKVSSWLDRSSHIVDTAGKTICYVRGNTNPQDDSKHFLDAAGKPLFTLEGRTKLSIIGNRQAVRSNGSIAFEVLGGIMGANPNMLASFTNHMDSSKLNIEFQDIRSGSGCELILAETGQVLATIAREVAPSPNDAVFGNPTYYISVEAGVDKLLMAALAVAFDDQVRGSLHVF